MFTRNVKIWQISASPSCLCNPPPSALFSIWRLMVEVVVGRCIHAARGNVCDTQRYDMRKTDKRYKGNKKSRFFPNPNILEWICIAFMGEVRAMQRAPLPRFRPRKPPKIPICHGSFSPTYTARKKRKNEKENMRACVMCARGKNQSTEEKGGATHTFFEPRAQFFFFEGRLCGGRGKDGNMRN